MRYGQKIVLEAHSKLYKKPLYLKAYPHSQSHFAKLSSKMEISITTKKDFSCVWIIEHPEINQRFKMVGTPVEADNEILFQNCSQGHWLATDKNNCFT